MTSAPAVQPTPRKPLRLWPGVAIAVLPFLMWFVVPAVVSDARVTVLGAAFCGLAVVVWWLFFSRAPWSDRVGAVVLMIVAVVATRPLLHPSIRTGLMGTMFYMYIIPVLSLALVAGAAASRRLADGPRRAAIAASILLACAGWTLLRTGGITGEGDADFHWRWMETPEDRLLAQVRDEPASTPPPPAAARAPEGPSVAQAVETPATVASPPADLAAAWPGFRGPERNGSVRGARIATDWSATPPVQLWRRPIGPGWSSFAVRGDLLYTQEQRGDHEVVACHKLDTGTPVWRHRDAARFWEAAAGAGPRATPTLGHGRVYTLGATGILNALDAHDGSVVWSRNAVSDMGAKVPTWGIASSPLVVGDMVIAATNGWLAGYDAATGKPRWFAPRQGGSYSSPQLSTIDGVAQIVLLSGAGVTGVAPSDGKVLWAHSSPGDGIVQPGLTIGGDVLIGSGSGMGPSAVGMRRVAVARGPDGWTVEERWMSAGLKPYYNDFVVHQGHAFGFDGGILACIDLEDGKRKWKGGRYGRGQLLLLPDQDVLLVLSEEGELALVGATPDQFTERARFPGIEGKTWNHPALVGDVLLVRNGEEMAAFRLPLAGH